MPASPDPANGDPVPATSGTPQRPSPRNRMVLAAVVATIVIAAAILGGLYAEGLGPLHRSPNAANGPVAFHPAQNAGAALVSGYDGGGWTLIAAGSASVRESESIPASALTLGLREVLGNCTVNWLSPLTTITIPGFSGSASSGLSPFWVLAYRNASTSVPGILVVAVVNGTAQLMALLEGTGTCATDLALAGFISPVSSSVLDSPEAVDATDNSGGLAYLQAHPDANVTMELSGPVNILVLSYPSTWDITFSTCPVDPISSGNELEFNATVNAGTGAVIFAQTVEENCSSLTTLQPPVPPTFPLAESLSFSSPLSDQSGGENWVNVTVEAAAHGIDFGNLSVSVSGPTVILPTPEWSVLALAANGTTLAEYNVSTTECIVGCSVTIIAGDQISVFSSTTSLDGGSISFLAGGQFVGFVQVAIPEA